MTLTFSRPSYTPCIWFFILVFFWGFPNIYPASLSSYKEKVFKSEDARNSEEKNELNDFVCDWVPGAPSNATKYEALSAIIGNKFYSFSGFTSGLQIVDQTEIYDPVLNQWTSGEPMPVAVTHISRVVVDGEVWIAGGYAGDHPGDAVDLVQIYDPQTDSWRNGPPLPAPRASVAMALVDRKIHIFGGLLQNRDAVSEHYFLDVDNQSLGWQSLADMPVPLNHHSAITFNGKIYSFGGQLNGHHGIGSYDIDYTYVYDPLTDQWSQLADIPMNRSHFESAIFIYEGKILIAGGRDKDTNNNNIYYGDILAYDPALDSFSVWCDLPGAYIAPSAGILGDQLIFANGGLDGHQQPQNTLFLQTIVSGPQPPVADAGADQVVILPSTSVMLNGDGYDPDGGQVTFLWTQTGGPSTATLAGDMTANLTASDLVAGIYTFELEVEDDENEITTDLVMVEVTSAPVFTEVWLEAECGAVGSGWTTINDGSASNGEYLVRTSGDNLNAPTDPNSIVSFSFNLANAGSYKVFGRVSTPSTSEDSFWVRANGGPWIKWNRISGDNSFSWHQVHDSDNGRALVTFDLSSGLNTVEIGYREDGTVLDKLYITKTGSAPTGEGNVAVNCSGGGFQPPIVNAGADQMITLPASSVMLVGGGNDPDGGTVSFLWTQTGGPSTATLAGEMTANLTASNLVEGIYTFQLEVTDDEGAKSSDEAMVTVSGLGWVDNDDVENYTGRHECAFVQAGNKFYLVGGRETANVDFFDYNTNSWSTLADPAPVLLNHFQGVEYGGLIWVIGALKGDLYPVDDVADYIWMFDPAAEEWIQGPEVPTSRKRGSASLVLHNDKFYVLAGNTNGHDGGYVAWFDEFDPSTGTWTTLEDAPHARDHFHSVVVDNKMYAMGGRLSGGPGGVFAPYVPEIDVYDFSTQTWSTLPSNLNLPTARASAMVALYNNKILVIGGSVENQLVDGVLTTGSLKIVEAFDPVAQTWSTFPETIFVRRATQAIVSGNGIFTTAGSEQLQGGSQKKMEYYGEFNPTGSPLSSSTVNTPSDVTIQTGVNSQIPINITGGNVGVFITSMEISGSNAASFNIVSGSLSNSFLNPGTTHDLEIEYVGVGSNESAVLTIYYGASSQRTVNLQSAVEDATPIADAGADQLVILPASSVMLNGEGYDPDGGPVTYLWTQTNGPSSATLSGDNSASLTASDLVEGIYTFQLEVEDDENEITTDLVMVEVTGAPAFTEVWLEAECGAVGSGWTNISDGAASNGEYLIRTSGNNLNTPTDPNSIVSFSFNLANAGSYKVFGRVSTPSTSEDSFWVRANGGSWIKWNRISGSSSFSWHQVHDSDNGKALVTFDLAAGINTIEIGYRETGTGLDKLYITETGSTPAGVGSTATNCSGGSSQPPIANAGPDQNITTTSASLTAVGSDPDGGPVSFSWTQTGGPNTATLSGQNSANLMTSNLVDGSYTFEVAVEDDENDITTDDVVVIVNTSSGGGLTEAWLEAECATVGSGWSTITDGSASNGEYLIRSSGNNLSSPTDPNSIVSFSFNLVDAGSYKVFGRVSTPSTSEDSFWVRANGGSWIKWNRIPGSSSFSWHQVHDSDNGKALVTFDLNAGMNTVEVGYREDGTGLDKLYITQTGSAPTDVGDVATNCSGSPAPSNLSLYDNTTLVEEITGVEEFESKVKIYPNPVIDRFTLKFENREEEIVALQLFNVVGRRIELGRHKISPGISHIEISSKNLSISPGSYYLQIIYDQNRTGVHRLLIR